MSANRKRLEVTYSYVTKRLYRGGFVSFLFTMAIVIPLSVNAGVFQSFVESDFTITTTESPTINHSPVDTDLLSATLNPAPTSARGGSDVMTIDDVLVSSGPIGRDQVANKQTNAGEISVYTVRDGDSLSQIAAMFDVTTNTILWANDLPRASAIKPGDTLIILPIAGVRHVVKSGDTVSTIAKKYESNAEDILSYNQLTSDTDLSVGDTLVIPGGSLHTETAKVATKSPSTKSTAKTTTTGGSFLSHPIPGAIKTQGIHGYNAVDFGVGVGATVRAAAAGQVIISKSSGWNGGYGNYIVIKHKNGVQTLYAHLSRNDVSVGESVAVGEAIGASGNTGKSTGPHLHFEVRGARNPF